MRIKQQVYWYWYSPVKMLLWIIGNLLKTARRNFLFNRISRPSLKRDLQSFRIWMNQNTKYCTQKFTFFRLLHTSTSKVTNKEKTCFVCGWKFQFFVIFTRSNGKKQYANPVPLKFLASYVEVHDKTRMSSYKKLKNIWKRDYIAFLH